MLARIGGTAPSPSFSTGGAAAALARLDALLRDIARRGPPLCDLLAAALPTLHASDRRCARLLLDAKRALFNGAAPKPAAVAALTPLLAPELAQALVEIAALHRERSALDAALPEFHARDLETAFARSLDEFARPALDGSIALTNPALHRRLVALRDGSGKISAKDRKLLATAVARYAWRASRKTSPLAAFGRVALSSWQVAPTPMRDDGAAAPIAPIALTGDRAQVVPRLAVLDTVAAALLERFDDLAADAPLLLNPTLRQEGGSFRWLALAHDDLPAARTRHTRASERSSTAPAIGLLRRLFDAAGGPLTVAALVDRISTVAHVDAGSAAAILRRAWPHQLLVLDQRGTPPLGRLDGVVAALVPARRHAVAAALGTWREALARPRDAVFVRTVDAALATLLTLAGVEAPAEAFHPLAFADALADLPAAGIDESLAAPWIPACAALLAAMPVLTCGSPLARLRRAMTEAFRARFGNGGRCDDVAAFFRTFIGDHPHLFGTGSPPLLNGDDDRLGAQRRALLRALAALAASGEPVTLSPDTFTALVGTVPAAAAARPRSHMFFVQPLASRPAAVLNQVYPGHGSMLTRFLPDDPRWTAPMRDYLADITPSGRPVEIAGTFGFNANLHPPFTDRVLDMPPFGGSGHREEATLSLDDLSLRYAPQTDDLAFVDAAGRRVDLCYLGILTPMLLPPMVQMARAVGLAGDSMQALWLQLADVAVPAADGTLALPRITVGTLVVVRALVAVRADRLPDPSSGDAAFFVAFNRWADERRLPRSLFYQRQRIGALHRDDRAPRRGEINWTRVAKPLPLDRNCPLGIRALQRSLAATDLDLVLVEALPDADDTIFSHDGIAVVGELGVELSLVAA